MPNIIKKLQDKPYKDRVKILWIAVIVTIIVLLAIWILTISLREHKFQAASNKYDRLKESFKELKQSINEARLQR